MKIAIQPCSNKLAKEHYKNTILNPVASSKIVGFLSEEEKKIVEQRVGERVAVWGVTPAVNFSNKRKWERLEPGDIALLYGDKRIFSQGVVSLCLHSRDLAVELWGTDKSGATWEYIYLLEELQEIEISIESYNKALGYDEKYVVQGFNVLEGERAERLADLLEVNFDEPVISPSVNFNLDYSEVKAKLSDLPEMTKGQLGQARAESQIFRDYLFGGSRLGTCDICGKNLPVGLLVAAHIKKRASCTDAEKRDPHVVMSACKLGCDELYERSYIYVDDDGIILENNNLSSNCGDLGEIFGVVVDRKCAAFTPENRHYFKWHREHLRQLVK